MENPLATSLIVSSMGLLFLFLALALLYGLMALMTAAIKDPPTARLPPAEAPAGVPRDKGEVLRAAAIAVALARADAEPRPASRPAADEGLSPWWALHHGRRLRRGSHTRRAR
jgi:Na+-transporting methylmalonyl-CoA/oxaloacetate decarboxylase gamma subunit